jgi:hypothetical protein
MNRFVLVAVLLIFFSGCSEFQHMHYRKLKKVPAHGFVETRADVEPHFANEITLTAESDSSTISKIPEAETITVSPVTKTQKSFYPTVLPEKKLLRKLSPVKKKVVEKISAKQNSIHKPGKFKSIFLLVLLLFFGTLAIMFGVLLIGGALSSFSLFVLVSGLAFIFLGFMPFLQLIFLIKKKSYEKMHGPAEERGAPR